MPRRFLAGAASCLTVPSHRLEKVTQQNAAMVEEASAAAGSLEEQSRSLTAAVAAFRLDQQLVAPAYQPVIEQPGTATANAQPRVQLHRKTVAKRKGNGHAEGWQHF